MKNNVKTNNKKLTRNNLFSIKINKLSVVIIHTVIMSKNSGYCQFENIKMVKLRLEQNFHFLSFQVGHSRQLSLLLRCV